MTHSTPFVVCGLHRSGTTFVGEILRQAGVTVIHEPLNEQFGMAGVPIAYPFVEKAGDVFARLLDDAVTLERPWNKDASFLKVGGIRHHLYALTGGRSGLLWGWLRLSRVLGLSPGRVCLKDPFMTLATPYLVSEHGLKVVCMVRHPAAIHYSTEKQNWRFDVDNLLRQPELVSRYGADILDSHWDMARKHAAASIAILWKFMVRINTALAREHKRLLIISHEELCLVPQETARCICNHFGFVFPPKLERFVTWHSEGGSAEARDGKTHDFLRNTRALVDEWRNRIAKNDEAMMREISGEDVSNFYGKW